MLVPNTQPELVGLKDPAGCASADGDLLPRFVACTLAQQLSNDFVAACHPQQQHES